MLKRHALSPFAAPAGLGPTMACCLLAYIHCAALQSSHGLRLTSRLMRDLWPACDQVAPPPPTHPHTSKYVINIPMLS